VIKNNSGLLAILIIALMGCSRVDTDNAQKDESSPTGGTKSALEKIIDKKWSIGELPCDLNGGAFQVFDRHRGLILITGGQEQVGSAPTEFEYIDKGATQFSYSQKYYANDMAAKFLGDSKAVTAMIEIQVNQSGKNKIHLQKKITQINFEKLLKGIKDYEVQVEEAENTLCESPASTPTQTPAPAPTLAPAPSPAPVADNSPFTPSFDCTKASNGQEKMVCADRALSKLDVDLSQAYAKAKEKAADKDKLKKEQLEWIKFSLRACSDKTCLLGAYQKRIAELQ